MSGSFDSMGMIWMFTGGPPELAIECTISRPPSLLCYPWISSMLPTGQTGPDGRLGRGEDLIGEKTMT